MKQALSARTLTYARVLVAAAFIGAIGAPGCGSDDVGVTDDAGAAGDGSADDGMIGDDAETDLDGSVVTGNDAKPKDASKDVKSPDAHPATYVSLGAAGAFVVLAGSTITNTGFTVITGNVAISPGTAITGFPPGIINGVFHSADAVAAKAKQDLNNAYNDAKSRSGAPVPMVGNLGGKTLGPGLYLSSTSMGIDVGQDLTLDGKGDEDAIWVFQIESTFIAMVGAKIILVGNAKADNVFWNVSSSATIGVGVGMVGNFLTETSITVQTGASMEGRFLTQTGAVTFDSNRVNRPKPVH
jgi:Ice-binding-like